MLSLFLIFVILFGGWQVSRLNTICNHYRLFKDRYVHRLEPIEAQLLMGFWGSITATAGLLIALANLDWLPGFWGI